MSRYLGTNLSNLNDLISKRAFEGSNNGFSTKDFYTSHILDKDSEPGKVGYKNNTTEKRVRCLDLTDADMSDSPLKRYHQVVICGDTWETNSDKNGKKYLGTGLEYIITAQLPKTFKYNIGGNWSQPMKWINDSLNNPLIRSGASSLSKGRDSAVFSIATMSTWESPKPLQIQLTLQCLDDIADNTNINVLESIDILSRWALPYSVNKLGTYQGIPGPAIPPITIKWDSAKDENGASNPLKKEFTYVNNKEIKRTGRLSVLVGGMLFLDWCILRDISVTYPNTKAQYLHDYATGTFAKGIDAGIRLLPVRADITLTFETILGITQTNFRDMLALRENNNPGEMLAVDIGELETNLAADSNGQVISQSASLSASKNLG